VNLTKTRILGSGFTRREYSLYGFDRLDDPARAMRYLSFEENHRRYHPCVNPGHEKALLEDKWLTHLMLSALAFPTPTTWGLYHPTVGLSATGAAAGGRRPSHHIAFHWHLGPGLQAARWCARGSHPQGRDVPPKGRPARDSPPGA